MMLKGVSANIREPDIIRHLPAHHQAALYQMCKALPLIVINWYLVILHRSILTLAFNGLLRTGKFSCTPHVIRVENVSFHNTIAVLFPTTKVHNKSFPQKVTVSATQQYCPIRYLLNYLQFRLPILGTLYIKQDFLPI